MDLQVSHHAILSVLGKLPRGGGGGSLSQQGYHFSFQKLLNSRKTMDKSSQLDQDKTLRHVNIFGQVGGLNMISLIGVHG